MKQPPLHEAASPAYDIYDESSDDDYPSYEAYAAFVRGMKMNLKTWSSLSKADKDVWDKITQQGKDTILRSRLTHRTSNNIGRPPDCTSRPTLP